MTLVSSEEAAEFMDFQKNYDKKETNIIDKDDEWYYNDKMYITNSHLSHLIKGGPQHLKSYYNLKPEDKKHHVFGKAQHCLLFEPEAFNQRFYSIDDTEICIEASGTDWKEKNKNPRATKLYKEWLEEIMSKNTHRQLLSLEDYTAITEMIDKAMSTKQVRDLVEAAIKKETIYSGKIKGLNVKCKVDGINPSNFIIDYKSTKDPATLRNFAYSAKKYGYPRQGAFYRDITEVDSFWFIVQEKTYPYTICLAELSPDSYNDGRAQYLDALDIYKFHFINNKDKIDDFIEIGSI